MPHINQWFTNKSFVLPLLQLATSYLHRDVIRSTQQVQTFIESADLAQLLTLTHPTVLIKSSLTRTVIRISTKMIWFVASEISISLKNIKKNSSTNSELSAKLVELVLSRNGKMPLKIPGSASWSRYHQYLLLVIHPTPPKISIKIRCQLFKLSCWQTNRRRQNITSLADVNLHPQI